MKTKQDDFWDDFEDMADYSGHDIISLDFNAISPFLRSPCKKEIELETRSMSKIIPKLRRTLSRQDKKSNMLILLKCKNHVSLEEIENLGWSIALIMDKQSLVVWVAKSYKMKNSELRGSAFKLKLIFDTFRLARRKIC